MAIIVATPAVELPITLEDARTQCMLDADITDEDALIESYIKAAADHCEVVTGRPLITQEKQFMGGFSACVELTPNLLSVESVEYLDGSGTKKTLSAESYFVNSATIIGSVQLLTPPPPVQSKHPMPVTINFTCGYGDAEEVPEAIKQAVRLLVGHWYRNREAAGNLTSEVAFSVSSLLAPYRVVNI